MVLNDEKKNQVRFLLNEFSGSLGDLGLFLPIVVAMTIATDMNIGMILVTAGLINILSGLIFKQPIPVQPMKAIAAIVITEGLVTGELIASGLIIGALLIALALAGLVDHINGYIPKAIVRGIQFGVGIKLALKGLTWIGGLNLFGWDSIFVAILVAGIILVFMIIRKPVILYVFLAGFLLLTITHSEVYGLLRFSLPVINFQLPGMSDWTGGFVNGVLPQLPLTLLNSVIAICALSADYFPGRGIKPKSMAISVGLMNLVCVPFGGIPMCHGAGGLAAQYSFGARTGVSVIMLGILKVLAGLIFGGTLLGLLYVYPLAILGPMLVFAGFELARNAKDMVSISDRTVVLSTALFIIFVNSGIGFLVGCLVHALIKLYGWLLQIPDKRKVRHGVAKEGLG